jgi:hypothetical protein
LECFDPFALFHSYLLSIDEGLCTDTDDSVKIRLYKNQAIQIAKGRRAAEQKGGELD